MFLEKFRRVYNVLKNRDSRLFKSGNDTSTALELMYLFIHSFSMFSDRNFRMRAGINVKAYIILLCQATQKLRPLMS
jgi:hypothetical protein